MNWITLIKRSVVLFKTATGPTKEEYEKIVKITLLLALAIGALGLVISFILGLI